MYAEGEHNGTQMCVSLHPALTGHPSRIDHLNDALSYMLSHEGVWQATADEIVEHYMDNYYDDNGRPSKGAGLPVTLQPPTPRRPCLPLRRPCVGRGPRWGRVGRLQPPHVIYRYRSNQPGFIPSISLIFHARFQFLSLFSLVIALSIVACNSYHTSRRNP